MRVFRFFAGILGLFMVMGGVFSLIAGSAMLAWASGDDARIDFELASSERVLVAGDHVVVPESASPGFRIHTGSDGGIDVLHHLDATVRVSGPKDLFLGIGPASEVKQFANDRGAVPTDQDFWLAEATGDDVTIEWAIDDRNVAAVLMNADGSPGIVANVRSTLPATPVRLAGGIAGIVGVGVATVGAGLMITMWREPKAEASAEG